MPTCLVLLDTDSVGTTDEPISPQAAELVTAGRRLGDVAAVWVGPAPAGLGEAVGGLGVGRLLQVMPDADPATPAVVAECLVAALAAVPDPVAVLLPAGRLTTPETVARVAVASGGGAVTGAHDVAGVDGKVRVTKMVLSASWVTTVEVVAPAVISLEPHAVPAQTSDPVVAEVEEMSVVVSDAARVVVPGDRTVVGQGTGRPPLTSAASVVVAGRGVDGDLSTVTDLADVLGAALGVTRVVVDEGWAGHDMLVGQTGASVAPRLYIGAGVSGQVHHVVGIQAAATVVAVNNDPDAPIFEHADYGIVGDVGEVLPALTAALRRRR